MLIVILLMALVSLFTLQLEPPQEVVLIDSAVHDPGFFLQQLQRHQHGILLSPHSTLASVTQELKQFKQLQAIHVVSHGAPGQLQLGQTMVNDTQLNADLANPQSTQSALLAQWGQVLAPGGDIVLYGCEVAATPIGQHFLKTLHRVTQADIAASVDRSGDPDNAPLGGNWQLESTIGTVLQPLNLTGPYDATLSQMQVTRAADSGVGTLRWAIAQANLTPEDDLIELHDFAEPIVLRSPLPPIRSNVYLYGHGATVSGNEQFRVFQIHNSRVVISELTIADGFAHGADGVGNAGGSAGLGGGLYLEDSNLILSRARLVNNRAEGGNGGDRPQPEGLERPSSIERAKTKANVNRGAITGINGISLSDRDDPALKGDPLTITTQDEKLSANRGALAGVNGIGVNGIGAIAFGGGGGFGGFGNAGNGGNGGNGGAAGGSGGNGGDGGDGGVGIFGSLGRWEADGGVGTIAFGGGGGFGGFGNAGNGGNGGNGSTVEVPLAPGGNGGNGGNGGFGGGGGGGGFGGQGGQGGTAGQSGNPGQGGFGGGDGELGYGGGGAGFGGAIFVKSGRLILHQTEFDQNAAIAGIGAHPGQGKGGAIFNLPGQDPDAAGVQVISLGDAPNFRQSQANEAVNTKTDNVDVFGTLKVFGSR
ncbi:MAG: DUF4347 domain-containing protein [Cyanobacteria bacterium P01_F01_bin.56]